MRPAVLRRSAVLLLLLIPLAWLALAKHKEDALWRRLQDNGRTIAVMLWSESSEDTRHFPNRPDSCPRTTGVPYSNDYKLLPARHGSFQTSTAFFRAHQEYEHAASGRHEYWWRIFGASELGIPVSTTQDPSLFLATNNAWCVVGDLDETAPPDTPFMFTKNLKLRSLAEGGTLSTPDGALLLAGHRAVVVQMAGCSVLLVGRRRISEYFAKWKGMTNVVLRP